MPRFLTRRHLIGASGAVALGPLLVDASPARVRAEGLATQTPPGPLSVFLPPTRVFDSRQPGTPLNGQKLQPDSSVIVTLPAEIGPGVVAVAMLLNCTVTQTEGAGFLVIRGSDLSGERPLPDTANVNWYGPGQTVGNLVCTDVGGENGIEVHNGGTGATHFIIDVQGFVPYEFVVN